MSAHSTGTGTGWLENLDVDQPHGLDYQEFNDFRIGVRKRMSQEHAAPADATVGGIHKPGGSAVLGMELTSGGKSDVTTALVNANLDGTYRGHGIVWAFHDASNQGRLFCTSAVAGVTSNLDYTVMFIHPDLQWGGRDITWTGAHQFDASVDVFGKIDASDAAFDGSVDISGALDCSVLVVDASADFSDVYVDGDLTVKGTVRVATDFSLTGDMAVDGTTNLSGIVSMGSDVSSQQVTTAWAVFEATKANTIGDQYNVASEAREAEGDYSVTFTSALADANYAVLLTPLGFRDDQAETVGLSCVSRKTTGLRINCRDSGTGLVLVDVSGISVLVFGG